MNSNLIEITDYIKDIIKGTPWENHVYAVGGSVRDYVMGENIKDIDLVIDLPNGGVEFANWCKSQGHTKTVVIYETYGTAAMKILGQDIECVMTRGEKYLDQNSRNPIVEFADLKEDALRRDLTINALYYNCSTGEILDIVGGRDDIKNHIIKTTNENPDIIFIDDPLRILRCVRFSTRYGWEIESKTFESMKKNVDRLSIITKERIQTEFNKIILSEHAVMGINILHEIGAIKYIIPEFENCYGLKQNDYHFGDVAEHTLKVLDHHCKIFEPNLIERLACFLHDIGKTETQTVKDGRIHFYDHEYVGSKICEEILKKLKYDNDTIKEVSFLIKNHMRTKQMGDGCDLAKDKTINKLLYDCKTRERFVSLMKIIECDNLSHKKEHCIYDQFTKLIDKVDKIGCYKKMFGYKLPISGNDIMEFLNISSGPIIAEINKRLLKCAFRNPEITKEECIKILPGVKKEAENYLSIK